MRAAQALFGALRHRGLAAWILLCAALLVVLHWPEHGGRLISDDYFHVAMVKGELPREPWELYDFYPRGAEYVRLAREQGTVGWWASETFYATAFRPLASLSLWTDLSLFGANPFALHVSSLAWGVLAVVAAGGFYRRALGAGAAALALLIFVCAKAQGTPALWIANRCAWMVLAFSCCGLWALVRARLDGWSRGRVLAAVGLALALLSGEYATGTIGYFALFEIIVAEDAWRARLRSAWPWLFVTLAYGAAHLALGQGTAGGDMYVDPLGRPWLFLERVLAVSPVVFLDALTGVTIPPGWLALLAALGAASILVLLLVFGASGRQRRLGFWLLAGSVLAAVPVVAAPYQTRLSAMSVLGAAGAVGVAVSGSLRRVWQDARAADALHAGRRAAAAWTARALVVLACVLLLSGELWFAPFAATEEAKVHTFLAAAIEQASRDAPVVAGKRNIVLVSPELLPAVPLVRAAIGLPRPEGWHVISPFFGPHRLERMGDRELRLTLPGDLSEHHLVRLFRGATPLVGTVTRLGPIQIDVLHERPHTVLRLRFDEALEQYQFVRRTGAGYVEVAPPPLGERVILRP